MGGKGYWLAHLFTVPGPGAHMVSHGMAWHAMNAISWFSEFD